MENNQISPPQLSQQPYVNYADDEIDLRELFGILWAEKWLIAGITAVAAIISVIVALTMTEVFRAEATLIAAEQERAGGGLASQLGGAAALLGVNVGGGGADKISTAIAVMNSREFIGRFIDEHELMVPLFAGKWDKATQTNVIDPEVYDKNAGRWLLKNGEPTRQQAFRKFIAILTVAAPGRDGGLVTVAIEWPDPHQAAQWVNQLVMDLNRDIKQRDVAEANNAIIYLRQQLEATSLVDMQRVFYQLIESQTRITMLADVRDEYVFRVIDPAIVPEQRFAPRRSLIAVIGTMAGGMLALMFGFVRRMFLNAKSQPTDSTT
jgi:LPS O-antigen subunit length determinant protein (WzzB/FepE family)